MWILGQEADLPPAAEELALSVLGLELAHSWGSLPTKLIWEGAACFGGCMSLAVGILPILTLVNAIQVSNTSFFIPLPQGFLKP